MFHIQSLDENLHKYSAIICYFKFDMIYLPFSEY